MELKLNAILREEAKSKITEVKRSTFYGGKPTGEETDLYIGKTRVTIRQGVVQSELPIDGPISKEIENLIVGVRAEFTMHEDILGVTRAKGKYAHPDDTETTGTVEFFMRGTTNISCYGPTREKTLALYEMIRDGSIRPVNEWDRAQTAGGPDYLKKIEAELEETKARLEGAMLHITGLKADLNLSEETFRAHARSFNNACEKNVRLRQVVRNIENTPLLPWVSRSRVAKQINMILDDNK